MTFFKKKFTVLTAYVFSIASIEIIAGLQYSNNLYLISISYYIHFLFLGYYIAGNYLKEKKISKPLLIACSAIPMIASLIINKQTDNFQSLDRALYNFIIVIMALISLYHYFVNNTYKNQANLLVLSTAIIFFSLDFVLALTSNYLVSKFTPIIGYIWYFRLLCIMSYYIAVVNLCFSKKMSNAVI